MTRTSAPRVLAATLACWLTTLPLAAQDSAAFPKVGDTAPDFTLDTPSGEKVQLAHLLKQGPVVLLVLRGYPGYQCPICNRQVGQFIAAAPKFADKKASVVLIYPGDASGLSARADEFIRGKTLPDNFYLLLDPDFGFTLSYRLRWQQKNETAYPATFVIDPSGKMQFAKISTTHGGRASTDEVLNAMNAK